MVWARFIDLSRSLRLHRFLSGELSDPVFDYQLISSPNALTREINDDF